MKVNGITERIANGVRAVQARAKSTVQNMDKKEKLIFGLTALGVLGAASVVIAKHKNEKPSNPIIADPVSSTPMPDFDEIFDRADDIKDEAKIVDRKAKETMTEVKALANSFENGTHNLEMDYMLILQGGLGADRIMVEKDGAEGFLRKTVLDKKGNVKSIQELKDGEMTEIKASPSAKDTYSVKKGVVIDGDTKKYDSIYYFVDGKFSTYKEGGASNRDERTFKRVFDFTANQLTYTENVTQAKADRSLAYTKSFAFDKENNLKDCIVNYTRVGSKPADYQKVELI